MTPYVITDSGNRIVASGIVQSQNTALVEVPEGCRIHFGITAALGSTKQMLVDGQVVDTQEPIFEATYQTKRMSDYPSVGEQMDMLWHAMNNGDMAKIEPFYSEILAVKQRFPKPSN
jgi:4-hydroxyphenylpyruvate dioxygenase-like putative hemolysin